jgi:hypothetical protein
MKDVIVWQQQELEGIGQWLTWQQVIMSHDNQDLRIECIIWLPTKPCVFLWSHQIYI